MDERFELFTVLIARASRCIYKIKSGEMDEFGLKGSHVSCLYYLYKKEDLTAKGLCDLCGEDKSNISRALKFLEQKGYLLCDSSTAKRYQSVLKLTQLGKQVGAEISKKIDNVLSVSSQGLSQNDREIFYKSLSLICDNLENVCAKY